MLFVCDWHLFFSPKKHLLYGVSPGFHYPGSRVQISRFLYYSVFSNYFLSRTIFYGFELEILPSWDMEQWNTW